MEATDSRIKVAIQKSGRLTEHSLELLASQEITPNRMHGALPACVRLVGEVAY